MNAREIAPALVLASPSPPVGAALLQLGWIPAAEDDTLGIAVPWVRPGGFPALVVHHDPVSGLEWLDVTDVHPVGRAALAEALHVATELDVQGWLADADPAVRLRGVLAAGWTDARALRTRIATLRLDVSPVVVRAAEACLLRWDTEDEARQRTLVAMGALAEVAREVVLTIGAGAADAFVPQSGDAALVFVGAVAPEAGLAYQDWWAEQRSRVRPSAGRGHLRIHSIPAGLMRRDGPWMRPLAQGFRGVAGALRPEVVWLSWSWDDVGATWDGLVFVGGHWSWFPKPYRVLQPLLERLWAGS